MSAQPIELPPDIYAVTSDNRLAVQATIDGFALPAPTLVARPDAVHIMLADIDDLAQWLYALGGKVHRGAETDGASLWTLRTRTPRGLRGTTVPLRVHAPVVVGEAILAEIESAVSK
ncbi:MULTISPECIES: hypothetical protein [unclassified Streptomyces]|uniref:hypothetical protein n=1 Tax=unclassified Streptomyces TaxID=2593676 RepID=UPI00343CC1B0